MQTCQVCKDDDVNNCVEVLDIGNVCMSCYINMPKEDQRPRPSVEQQKIEDLWAARKRIKELKIERDAFCQAADDRFNEMMVFRTKYHKMRPMVNAILSHNTLALSDEMLHVIGSYLTDQQTKVTDSNCEVFKNEKQ